MVALHPISILVHVQVKNIENLYFIQSGDDHDREGLR